MVYQRKATAKQVDLKLVDVFTKEPFQGNSLVVVLYGENLTLEEKTSIIREMNASKGVFIGDSSDGKSDFKINSYSRHEEIICDYHSLIGSTFIMITEKQVTLKDGVTNVITVQTKDGVFPLLVQSKGRELQQLMIMLDWKEKAEFRRIDYDNSMMAEALGLAPEDIRRDVLIQAVKMNHWSVMVPLTSKEALNRVVKNRSKLINLATENNVELICLFYTDESQPDNKIYTRAFNPSGSNNGSGNYFEDLITGLSNPGIAAYVFEHKLIPTSGSKIITTFVQQSNEGRIGEIVVEMVSVNDIIKEIYIGGNATCVLDGKMKLTQY